MRRILELDALRGIAALTIVLAHVGLIPGSTWALSAVDLFFVLSGYLITTNVLRKRREPGFLSVYYIRRALRIWPPYYLALGACLLLNQTLNWDSPPDAWPYYLTFTQNVHEYLGWPLPRFSGMFLHTWTLAIEEQFYILWPLLLLRSGRRVTLTVILTFSAVAPVLRAWGYSPILMLTRCDGLALGSLLAVVLFDRDRVSRHVTSYCRAFAAIGMGALVLPWLAGLTWPESATGQVVGALFTSRACLVYFGLVGLTICLQGRPALMPLRDGRLCHIGAISYGLYLYHTLVLASMPALYKRIVFRRLGLTSTVLMDLVMVAVSFALAELSWHYLEMPIQSLKERLTLRRVGLDATYQGPHEGLAVASKGSEKSGVG